MATITRREYVGLYGPPPVGDRILRQTATPGLFVDLRRRAHLRGYWDAPATRSSSAGARACATAWAWTTITRVAGV